MDINSRINRQPNPQYTSFIGKFVSTVAGYYPPVDSILGLFAYSLTVFVLFLIFKILYIKLFGDPFIGNNPNNEEPFQRKADPKILKQLQERRKQRTEEAKKLLDKIQKIN